MLRLGKFVWRSHDGMHLLEQTNKQISLFLYRFVLSHCDSITVTLIIETNVICSYAICNNPDWMHQLHTWSK